MFMNYIYHCHIIIKGIDLTPFFGPVFKLVSKPFEGPPKTSPFIMSVFRPYLSLWTIVQQTQPGSYYPENYEAYTHYNPFSMLQASVVHPQLRGTSWYLNTHPLDYH